MITSLELTLKVSKTQQYDDMWRVYPDGLYRQGTLICTIGELKHLAAWLTLAAQFAEYKPE